MDPEAEGLSFLDWGSVNDEIERQTLYSILYPVPPPEQPGAVPGDVVVPPPEVLPPPPGGGGGGGPPLVEMRAPEVPPPPAVTAPAGHQQVSSWADEVEAAEEEAAAAAAAAASAAANSWEQPPPSHQEFADGYYYAPAAAAVASSMPAEYIRVGEAENPWLVCAAGGNEPPVVLPSGVTMAGGGGPPPLPPPPRGAVAIFHQPLGPPQGAVLTAAGGGGPPPPLQQQQPPAPPPGVITSSHPGPVPTGAPLQQTGPPPSQQPGPMYHQVLMNPQSGPGIILGNVSVNLNANVQSYVPVNYQQQQQQQQQHQFDQQSFDKERRRSGSSKSNKSKPQREYNMKSEEQSPTMPSSQYPQQYIYPNPAHFNYMPQHTTAQQVAGMAGTPLFITAHMGHMGPIPYPQGHQQQHPHMYYPTHLPYFQVPMMQAPTAATPGHPPMIMEQGPPIVPPQEAQDFSVPPPVTSQHQQQQQQQQQQVMPSLEPPPPQVEEIQQPQVQQQQVEKRIPVEEPKMVQEPILAQVMPPQQVMPQQPLQPPQPPVPQPQQPMPRQPSPQQQVMAPPPAPQQQPVPTPPVQTSPQQSLPMDSIQAALPEIPPPKVVEVPQEAPPPTPVTPPAPVEPAPSPPVTQPEPKSPEPPKVAPRPPVKSWASIVQASATPSAAVPTSAAAVAPASPQSEPAAKPLARVNPYSGSQSSAAPAPAKSHGTVNPLAKTKAQMTDHDHMMDDPMLYRLGEYLCRYNVDHRSSALQPRGLTNRGNWCYVNATLQALVACPSFFNLMRNLPIKLPSQLSRHGRHQQHVKSPTPIIDAVVEFMQEFSVLPPGSRPARKEKAAVRKGEEGAVVDVPQGPPFEPSCVYAMLSSIRSATFKVEGRQEDAEEFLSCLLNALNDEMLELMKLVEDPRSDGGLVNGQVESPAAVTNGGTNHHLHSEDEDGEQWTVMRGKNRACLTRKADFGRTPISDIFRGQLCSHVQRKGEQHSENVQPFYTLQLDIEKARSVREALEQMVDRDWLEGVTCSRTQQQVEAWQQVTLEELPPVLLLHLKWFDYKPDGCTKIMKNMEYSVDLKIENKLLSKSTSKYTAKQRIYKLFAVVYHDGKEASKGHYITDAYHSALGVWVRFDDNQVRVVSEQTVTHPRSPAVPYILYYRRSDTMGLPLVGKSAPEH